MVPFERLTATGKQVRVACIAWVTMTMLPVVLLFLDAAQGMVSGHFMFWHEMPESMGQVFYMFFATMINFLIGLFVSDIK